MTNETAFTHMTKIGDSINRNCRNFKQARRCAEKYAGKHGLKFKDGDPAIIYEPGEERVILFFKKPDGGIHMEIAVSPAYAFLDQFDSVLFA